MKKLLLFSFLFVFAFTLSACSSTNVEKENLDEQANQIQEETPKQEEIKNKNVETAINDIKSGDTISSPITITGTTNATKNQLFVELRDSEHNSKVRGYAVIDENDEAQNDFKITLNFVFNSTKEGFIAVYELDDNGQEKNLVEIPVKYEVSE
ncbi:MAG: hypothetical protein PF572_04575 [Patescibacteria group bacterium]|jgi:hypothetical protein|nr:hypothetical protein [Patescibacteria group bacterium]